MYVCMYIQVERLLCEKTDQLVSVHMAALSSLALALANASVGMEWFVCMYICIHAYICRCMYVWMDGWMGR